jgi:hypothetical protein
MASDPSVAERPPPSSSGGSRGRGRPTALTLPSSRLQHASSSRSLSPAPPRVPKPERPLLAALSPVSVSQPSEINDPYAPSSPQAPPSPSPTTARISRPMPFTPGAPRTQPPREVMASLRAAAGLPLDRELSDADRLKWLSPPPARTISAPLRSPSSISSSRSRTDDEADGHSSTLLPPARTKSHGSSSTPASRYLTTALTDDDHDDGDPYRIRPQPSPDMDRSRMKKGANNRGESKAATSFIFPPSSEKQAPASTPSSVPPTTTTRAPQSMPKRTPSSLELAVALGNAHPSASLRSGMMLGDIELTTPLVPTRGIGHGHGTFVSSSSPPPSALSPVSISSNGGTVVDPMDRKRTMPITPDRPMMIHTQPQVTAAAARSRSESPLVSPIGTPTYGQRGLHTTLSGIGAGSGGDTGTGSDGDHKTKERARLKGAAALLAMHRGARQWQGTRAPTSRRNSLGGGGGSSRSLNGSSHSLNNDAGQTKSASGTAPLRTISSNGMPNIEFDEDGEPIVRLKQRYFLSFYRIEEMLCNHILPSLYYSLMSDQRPATIRYSTNHRGVMYVGRSTCCQFNVHNWLRSKIITIVDSTWFSYFVSHAQIMSL